MSGDWSYSKVYKPRGIDPGNPARVIEAGDVDANFPIAHLRPSLYRVTATTQLPMCVSILKES